LTEHHRNVHKISTAHLLKSTRIYVKHKPSELQRDLFVKTLDMCASYGRQSQY